VTRGVYVTAMEPRSGKSVVSLGLMEALSARSSRVGFFRPVVAGTSEPDRQVELMRRRFRLDSAYGAMRALTDAEAGASVADGDRDHVEKTVVAAYRDLARGHELMVCEGIDQSESAPALDFDFDLRLAGQLGCPVLLVVQGRDTEATVEAVRAGRESLERRGCELFGIVASRVPAHLGEQVAEGLAGLDVGEPVYVVQERADLARPTVAEVAAALDARPLNDPGETLHREVQAPRAAAMSVEHFIDDLEEGALVVVPGDRADIVVASCASAVAPEVPAVAGVVLTAGYEPAEAVRRLIDRAPFPVFETPSRTFAVASAVAAVQPHIEPDDERRIANALGAFQAGVDPVELGDRIAVEREPRMTPVMFEYELLERAKEDRRHIVLPEGDDDRVLQAADILLRRGAVALTILGRPEQVGTRAAALGLELSEASVVDPESSPLRKAFAERYHELRAHKGMTEELAFETVADESYFGTLMVLHGEVDGMVSGAAHTTGDTIRPAFEIIKARPGVSVVSSVFLMCLADRVLVYGDCAVNPKPDVEQLADIAIGSAETAWSFGIEPRVAMLSYSTGESGKGEDVDRVRDATATVRERRPDLSVEGPIQYDAAVDASVARVKLPESDVAGQATVLVFPDLHTGNIAYKAVQRSAGAVAVGPVLQGLRKPVNDLSRGCTVQDIVSTVVITAIQAQEAGGRSTSRLRTVLPGSVG
jgi:phosphate acetyltransferase